MQREIFLEALFQPEEFFGVVTAEADGSIRSCDPRMVTFALFGAFNWITFWYRENGPLNADTIADYYIALFARGIAVGDQGK